MGGNSIGKQLRYHRRRRRTREGWPIGKGAEIMAIAVQCSACRFGFQVKDKWSGRRVKCRRCGGPVEVPGEKLADEAFATTSHEPQLRDDPAVTGETGPSASRSGSGSGGSTAGSHTGTTPPRGRDLAYIDAAGGAMRPLGAPALSAAEQLTFEYRDPWDLAHSAIEMRARTATRMCRRWKYPFEPLIEAHLWKLLLLISVGLLATATVGLYQATKTPGILSLQLAVGLLGYTALLPLLVRTSKSCAQLLRYDGGTGLAFKTSITFILAGGCVAAILAAYDQPGFYAAIAVGVIVSGITLLILMRLEPLEAILTTTVCALTFGGGLAVVTHIALLVGIVGQAFSIGYVPPVRP